MIPAGTNKWIWNATEQKILFKSKAMALMERSENLNESLLKRQEFKAITTKKLTTVIPREDNYSSWSRKLTKEKII